MNGYLLDTNVVLWVLEGNPRLGPAARRALSSGRPLHVSPASTWELGIKARIGKIVVPANLAQGIGAAGLTPLPVTIDHTLTEVALPHRDPFDHLIVAQARCEDLVLVTADRVLIAVLGEAVLDARL